MSVSTETPHRGTATRRAARRDAMIADLRAALAARPPGPGVVAVLLFGSWARGDFEGLSDVDLLVLTEPGTPATAFDTAGLPMAQRLDVVLVEAADHRRHAAEGHPFHARVAREAVRVWPDAG